MADQSDGGQTAPRVDLCALRGVDSGPSGATRHVRTTLHDLQYGTKGVRIVAYRLNDRG